MANSGAKPRQRGTPQGGSLKTSDTKSGKPASGKQQNPSWGRASAISWGDVALVFAILALAPLGVGYFVLAVTKFDCSLVAPVQAWLASGRPLLDWLAAEVPGPTREATGLYGLWLLYQLAMALWLPGPTGYGQLTPAGHKLPYLVNGFNVWVVTHVLYAGLSYTGHVSATVIYDHWVGLVWCMMAYGYGLAVFSFVKAYVAPTHRDDCKFSGSLVYDFFMGIELNPRIGSLDFKLFHNGRIGIVLWTLIDLSCAAKQYELHGHVTVSMVLLNVLHAMYVVDFFWNEDWYLRTIDICHDHFGFYLAWGDATWLPVMYTLQAFFLVQYPVELTPLAAALVLALGLGGYFIFRSVNDQKDKFRSSNGQCAIWGKPARFIRATFATADGAQRESLLLTSGWWGLSRHANYIGDLMISTAFCLTCGLTAPLPYFYIVYMTALLVGRSYRDEDRCRGKYGKYWEEYCKAVPYRILPGVF